MRLKRISLVLSLCLAMMLILTSCNSSKSFTFQIDNGEKIKISLDTTKGYDLTQNEGTVIVQKNGEDILMGIFLTAQGYEDYAAAINASSDVKIIEASPENSPVFYLYKYEGEAGTETTFLFKVEGAETGALFSSVASKEEAEAAYDLLKFEKE